MEVYKTFYMVSRRSFMFILGFFYVIVIYQDLHDNLTKQTGRSCFLLHVFSSPQLLVYVMYFSPFPYMRYN